MFSRKKMIAIICGLIVVFTVIGAVKGMRTFIESYAEAYAKAYVESYDAGYKIGKFCAEKGIDVEEFENFIEGLGR